MASDSDFKESDDSKRYELQRVIERLDNMEGSGTQLVTIYIPPDRRISDVVSQLRDEHGEASNIKSKQTRTNVQDALSSILSRLKHYDEPPEKGMVVFSGAVDVGSDQTDMETIVLENPPKPIQSYIYHCDSNFLTDPLKEMLRDDTLYGLIVLDRREANVGWLKGKRIEPVASTTSLVPGKQRKGGQSAQRFARLRREAIDKFYKDVAEMANEVFVPKLDELDGVLVGGPSPTKEEFVDGDYLHHELQKRLVGKFDVSYTDESGLSELVDTAQEALADLEVMKDKKVMKRFFDELRQGELATYGEDVVRKNLQMGAVDTLLLSEDLRRRRVTYECPNDGHEEKITVDKNRNPVQECPECGTEMQVVDEEDVVDELVELAEQMGTEIKFISTDFEEGAQLKDAFGGVAGILRYNTGV
ncbi:MAG: peptide chain release factor aRF-1 [Halobacteria archaeon]|nr:peptide chain release factor aRF-1 [Halobacteria archaeon]